MMYNLLLKVFVKSRLLKFYDIVILPNTCLSFILSAYHDMKIFECNPCHPSTFIYESNKTKFQLLQGLKYQNV